jgi:hypothetical protein
VEQQRRESFAGDRRHSLVSNAAFFDQFFLAGAAGGDVTVVVDPAGAPVGAGGGGGRLMMRSTRCLGPPGPLCCSTVCADAIDAVDPVRAAASVKVLISICLPRRMVIAVSSCERDKTIDGRGRKIWRGFGKDCLIREGSRAGWDL